MRIAFHVPRASWLVPGYSGDHVLVSNLMTSLTRRGHELKVASRLDAWDVCRGRLSARQVFSEARAVRKEMAHFSPDAWFVYMPTVTYPDLFGWWQSPKRYVIWAADTGRRERLPIRWRSVFSAAHRHSLERADKVSVYRPGSAVRLQSAGVASDRVCLLPPPVTVWEALPTREAARQLLGLPQDVPVILCVSRFTLTRKDGRPGKAEMLVNLVRAAASLPAEAIVVLVGDGRGRQQVEAEIGKRKSGARILTVGQVPDVRPYYAACDVFAYPYTLDRPWVAVLEAQACGRPVVTMRTGSATLITVEGRTSLLAEDLEEFEQHLVTLVNDRARRTEMGKAAHDYTREFHSMDVRTSQIERVLLGTNQAGSSR